MFGGNPQIPVGENLFAIGSAVVGLINLAVCFPNKFGPTESQHAAGFGAIHKICGSQACLRRGPV